MPPRKKLAYDVNCKELPLQRLLEIIIEQDIQILDQYVDNLSGGVGYSGKANDRSKEFYSYVNDLVNLGELRHQDLTVNGFIQGSVARSTSPMHLCVIAALHNRKNAFKILTDTFGKNIGSLLDSNYKANILHHIFAPRSLADHTMIDEVFYCLNASLTKSDILKLIDATDKDGQTVGDYAKSRDLQMAVDAGGGVVDTYTNIYLAHKLNCIDTPAHHVSSPHVDEDDVTITLVLSPQKRYLPSCACGFFPDKDHQGKGKGKAPQGHEAYPKDSEKEDLVGSSSSSPASKQTSKGLGNR